MAKPLKMLAVLSCIFAVTFCGQLTFAQDSSKLKIGFSFEAMKGERWQTDLDSFEARAKQLGAEVIYRDANGDDQLQVRQVKDMIAEGIKVLVLLPHDTANASKMMVEAAKAANVKVISYDRLVLNSDAVDLYVSFDRVAIGRMQAEYLVQRAPKGNYVLIGGSPNDEGAKTLHDVQLKILQPYIDRGDIKVIADGYAKDWLATEAYLSTLAAIDSSKGNIVAVLASNDGLAGGAIQALREHNLVGKVLVSGQDADLASIVCIVQGAQSMTVYKPIVSEAVTAAEQAVHLARNEKPKADIALENGKMSVPAILLKPILVTKENIKDTVVKDGFQTLQRINEGLSKEQQIH